MTSAHAVNDWYSNFIQILVPFFVSAGLGIAKSSFLVSAFTLTSAVMQPVSGYLVDTRNVRRLVHIGTLWMGVLLCFSAIIGNYALTLIIVALSGLGTAAFHPQASAIVASVSGNHKGTYQSIFVAGGNVGLALTPLLLVPFVENFGLESLPWLAIPAVIMSVFLWTGTPRPEQRRKSESAPLGEALRKSRGELLKLISVVSARSLAYFGFVTFLPLYFVSHSMELSAGSVLIFVMLSAGAFGGIVGGIISDRIGRKPVIVGSLLLAGPLFGLFLISSGILSYILLFLAGSMLLSSFSVTVVSAQELIGKNAATASGLMLGFGVGIGGMGVGLLGIIADNFGIDTTIGILIFLPILAGLFATLLKKNPISDKQPGQ